MQELDRGQFANLLAPLRRVPINHLFARSVVERRVDGRVWVDRVDDPRLVHVIHPYGMTLLCGSVHGVDPQALTKHLIDCRRGTHDLWLQPSVELSAPELDALLDATPASPGQAPGGPGVQRYTRTNFRYDPMRGARQRTALAPLVGAGMRPLRTDEFALPDISVSPHRFWRNWTQFQCCGGGWCVERDGALTSMAFCSFRFDDQFEIGVETRTAARGRGDARHVASLIVAQCVAAGLEPVWSCRKENRGSYQLALALGFEPTLEIPYYRLPAFAAL